MLLINIKYILIKVFEKLTNIYIGFSADCSHNGEPITKKITKMNI